MHKLDLNTKIKRIDTDIVSTELEETFVLLNVEKGKYYNFNRVSSDIWKQLQEQATVTEIVNAICNKYDCTEEQCNSDTLDFLNQLNSNGLLQVV